MPVSAEDAIWGATDKELVRCRGSFVYNSWLLCGGRKPSLPIPEVRDTHTVAGQYGIGRSLYSSFTNQVVYNPQIFQPYPSQTMHQEDYAAIERWYPARIARR